MKKCLSFVLIVVVAFIGVAVRGVCQEVRYFTAILATNSVPQDLVPIPMRGFGSFTLAGKTLEFNITVDQGAPWVATIHDPEPKGPSPPVSIPIPGGFCFAPLPPSHGSCLWIGSVVMSQDEIADLLASRLFVSLTWGGFPPGFAVEGRIFLDNNQNRIPDTEEDTDGDGVSDAEDMCPNTPPGVAVNSRGCTVADLCPCDAGWKNHGQYVSCVDGALVDFVKRGSLTSQQAREIISQSARSDCGKKGGAAK